MIIFWNLKLKRQFWKIYSKVYLISCGYVQRFLWSLPRMKMKYWNRLWQNCLNISLQQVTNTKKIKAGLALVWLELLMPLMSVSFKSSPSCSKHLDRKVFSQGNQRFENSIYRVSHQYRNHFNFNFLIFRIP